MTQVSLVVDAQAFSGSLFPDDDVDTFVSTWRAIEPQLVGRSLTPGLSFPVRLDGGEITFVVASTDTPAPTDQNTGYGVIAVREPPHLPSRIQCSACRFAGRARYGAFACAQCSEPDQRLCDEHAQLLPGGLDATCVAHRLTCDECGRPGAARCPGPRCKGRKGWCSTHLHRHRSDPTTSYCKSCLEQLFPPCGFRACDGVGSIECDHLDERGHRCRARRCTRHARQWQVFGPHREGLGRCDAHQGLRQLTPDQLLYQVLGACASRRVSAPTLPSLRHMLMKVTGVQRSVTDVLDLARATPNRSPALGDRIGELVTRESKRWTAVATQLEDALQERTAELKAWLIANGNTNAATMVVGTSWVRPREGRPGMLFVRCDPRYLPRPWRDAADGALGFSVRLERNG